MTAELTVLVLVALLTFAQISLGAVLMTRQHGADYNAGPRDARLPLTGIAGRADRALRNHYEGLPLFIIAVVALSLADRSTGLTGILAWIYLIARIAYVPAYLYALTPWRSLIWLTGMGATILMLVIALL